MAEVSMSLLAEVEAGKSLADAIAESAGSFPPLLRALALAGERAGKLHEALAQVAECLTEADRLGVEPTSERQFGQLAGSTTVAPAVALASRLLRAAIEADAAELRLTGGTFGGRAEVKLSGTWRVLEEVGRDMFGPLCRRFKLMAQIPYWIAEPAVGSFPFETPEDETWDVAVRTIPEEAGSGQRIDMTLKPRTGRHEPA